MVKVEFQGAVWDIEKIEGTVVTLVTGEEVKVSPETASKLQNALTPRPSRLLGRPTKTK